MSEKPSKHDQVLEQRAHAALEEDLSHLDAATLSKLRQAREKALDVARQGQPSLLRRPWLTAGIPLAAAAMLIAVLSINLNQQTPAIEATVATTEALDDLELLAATDDIELYADLDFLIWLEQQDYAS